MAFRLRGQRTEKILEPLSLIMNDFIPDHLHSAQHSNTSQYDNFRQ
jgi:hypothetical protein